MQSLYAPSIIPQAPVSSLKTLTFGIAELDNFLGGLGPGDFIVLHGSRICHDLSELMCVRSQLPYAEGGLDSSAVFIDGGNLFDPYLISESARLVGLDPERTLRNMWISRAFTSYQMVSLITERLRPLLDQEKSRLVLVSDIAALFCDSDIGMFEAKRTFNRVTLFLWNLAKKRNVVLAVTSLSSRSKRKRRLEQYLLGRADIVVRVEAGNPHVKIVLEKHPSAPPTSAELSSGEQGVQPIIEDFLGVQSRVEPFLPSE